LPTGDEFNESFREMPETLARLKSAILFAGVAGKQTELWRVSAYLRASLSDFCSVEEMQQTDHPSKRTFKIEASPDPLLHLLELLRHLNVHVRGVESKSHSINVQFKEQSSEMEIHVIADLVVQDLSGLRNGKRYFREDLQRMLDWFNESQLYWGAGDIIVLGANRLGSAICNHYALESRK
jgi:hypothetical protein